MRVVRKRHFNCIELFIVIAVIGTLMALMIPAAVRKAPEKAKQAHCKSKLKAVGNAVASHYEQFREPQKMPVTALDYVRETDFNKKLKGLKLTCPAGGNRYIWLTDTYTLDANKKLAGDSSNHTKLPHRFAVFEDGHVE
jgi:Tfp pilus assembly protein PilE